MKRVFLIVLDGVGVGYLPDADRFGDVGSNTIANTAKALGGLTLPNLQKFGLGNITEIMGVKSTKQPIAAYGKANEKAASKDSTSGHWEIAGLFVDTNFAFYPDGFPKEILDKFCKLTKVPGVLLNKPYSGTDAIVDYGQEHVMSKKPIVYTSADSVFQIACHEEIYPLDRLYKMCEISRNEIFDNSANVGRVIARPFLGNSKTGFYRTNNRKDYSLTPPRNTILDHIKNEGKQVVGVGKIEDLFDFKGITQTYHSKTNQEGIDYIVKFGTSLKEDGLIFANLVDFDTLWGHRNLPKDFANGLAYFDSRLGEIMGVMRDEDILFLTADHGCDPTTASTDHSREYIPILVYGKGIEPINLGIRETFSDIGATICDYLKVQKPENGKSFLDEIL